MLNKQQKKDILALHLQVMNTKKLLNTLQNYGFLIKDIDIDKSLAIFENISKQQIIITLRLISKDIFYIEKIQIK